MLLLYGIEIIFAVLPGSSSAKTFYSNMLTVRPRPDSKNAYSLYEQIMIVERRGEETPGSWGYIIT